MGWHRRFLPHCNKPGLIQFITYRLADSLPAASLVGMEAEIRKIPPNRREMQRRQRIEAMLDRGHGSEALADPMAAECIIANWQHFDAQHYDLLAWVVMPTHVHVMIHLAETASLAKVVQSWKSYTGRRLKALFPQACVDGQFWMREYWDRYIRDETHFLNAVEYIRNNPVKANRVKTPEEWPYLGISGALSVLGASPAGYSPPSQRSELPGGQR
ncbi:MAG: transposase [Gammaproteobacteria bacterium SHHR-1]